MATAEGVLGVIADVTGTGALLPPTDLHISPDLDPNESFFSGVASFTIPSYHQDITHYEVFLSESSTPTTANPLASVDRSAAVRESVRIPRTALGTATHVQVYSANAAGRSATFIEVEISDLIG